MRSTVTIVMTAAILVAGSLLAEAVTWTGMENIRTTAAKILRPAEVVHCRRWGRCPLGMRLTCDDLGRCRCVPC